MNPFSNSITMQMIVSKGLKWKQTDDVRIELETCPWCHKVGFGNTYVIVDSSNKDGLYLCHRCGSSGNRTTLRTALGMAPEPQFSQIAGMESQKDKKVEALPNVEDCHQALLADENALDYLMNGRGFSREIIEKQKIGLTKRFFRECGDVRAIVYPYLVGGQSIFARFRTLPTMPLASNAVPKAFSSPTGHEVPLYNGEIIRDGLKEIILAEGEANSLALMDKGVEYVVGVPGANIRKALWLEQLDAIPDLKIYIAYDRDRVGQKAAQELAARIGIDKCYKIKLPEFQVTTDSGEVRAGKDFNEYFTSGGTFEGFEKIKSEAKLFDVDGVVASTDSLDLLEESLEGLEGLSCKYVTPWNSLNKLVGFDDGDVIDIIAAEKVGKSVFALNLMEHMVATYNEDAVIICMEMPTARVTRNWVCHLTGTRNDIPKTPEDAKLLLENMRAAIKKARYKATNREAQLHFCYPQIKTADDMYKLIRDCVRRYGAKWVCVDNLQLLCDRTLANAAHRTIHLSQISKQLAGITKDLGIKMIRVVQPHRIREGQLVTTDNVDGSSQLAKDIDCGITLNRGRANELSAATFATMSNAQSDTAFDSKMLVSVGLSRYSSGGYTTLSFDGATSTVTEYNVVTQAVSQGQQVTSKVQEDITI